MGDATLQEPEFLTAPEAVRCEGYYLDLENGNVLRVVRQENEECAVPGEETADPTAVLTASARFVVLSADPRTPIPEVESLVRGRFGREPSGRTLNWQTARQEDGSLRSELAWMVPGGSRGM